MPLNQPPRPLCFVNLWRAKDGRVEAEAFVVRDQALEEIGAGYPDMIYTGTATLPKQGMQATFEDWSEEAHQRAMEATETWLDGRGARRWQLGKVL